MEKVGDKEISRGPSQINTNRDAKFSGRKVDYFTEILPCEIRLDNFCSSAEVGYTASGLSFQSQLILREVSQCMKFEIDSSMLCTLAKNYDKTNAFYPFKKELIPDFLSTKFSFPLAYYLISLDHLYNPICTQYVKKFQYYLNYYLNAWRENNFHFTQSGDVFDIIIQDKKVIKLSTKHNPSLFMLCHFVEQYFLSQSKEVISNLKSEASQTFFNFLKCHRKGASDVISNLIFHFYEQCCLEDDFNRVGYFELLIHFTDRDLIDKDKASEFLKLIISIFKDPKSSAISQINAVILLSQFVRKSLVTMDSENAKFLKDYILKKLVHGEQTVILFRGIFNLLIFLLQKNICVIDAIEAEFIKVSVLQVIRLCEPILNDDADSALKSQLQHKAIISILIIRKQMGANSIRFDEHEIIFLKNFVMENPDIFVNRSIVLFLLGFFLSDTDLFPIVSEVLLKATYDTVPFLCGEYPFVFEHRSLVSFYERCLNHPDQSIKSLAADLIFKVRIRNI